MSRSTGRVVATAVAVLVALVLQVTVLPSFAWDVAGIALVPGLVLLVVVAVALGTDTRFATLTGFAAGLLVDLAPPADHVAGRWALALTLVGYVVGRLVHDTSSESPRGVGLPEARAWLGVRLAAAAGGSFIGTSVFALTGILLQDGATGIGDLLPVALASLVLDVGAAIVVIPLVLWLLDRLTDDGPRASYDVRRVASRTQVR